jgi:hypothetical protein
VSGDTVDAPATFEAEGEDLEPDEDYDTSGHNE